ncbi:SHOCT domain-containing protein [Natrialbaceae archaeon AArc-T1-2]|uniref:SHOCT domain-containing protein n=1 Tax=Natrialbaceae archaeon AArc-T1-2 TaxID=3053904 RepID=UPI00255B12E6|nr:SHOCT domain-containing protein [Natrialbaceae archaeon AArc-T1-2]WIV66756.1 SHOCT domain-containing protein [Natrialbaceae archaeon AArc-T1-2]
MAQYTFTPGTGGVVLLAGVSIVVAQHGPGGSMGDGWGWGPFGGWMGPGLFFVLAVVAVLALAASGGDRSENADGHDRALSELRERYARGELSEAEFEKRRRRLLSQGENR